MGGFYASSWGHVTEQSHSTTCCDFLQVLRVSERLKELDVGSPLKTVLTGVELLLARAQQWELTAAKHVSLAKELAPLAALAARWRKFELQGWRSLISRVRLDFSNKARKVRPIRLWHTPAWKSGV